MSLIESVCEFYDADSVFKRFKVIEFPMSLVGLSSSQELSLDVDLDKLAYLKTVCEGKLMNFEDAREISPSHRAFQLTLVNNRTLKIDFKPTNECVSKAVKQKKHMGNRFVFDLRLIKTYGTFCCNDESHAEIGRFYISGQYEFCKISHTPNVIDFDVAEFRESVVRKVRIINDSKIISTRINAIKTSGFVVSPSSIILPPDSSKQVTIKFRPPALKVPKTLLFFIRNPNDNVKETNLYEPSTDDNFLEYVINIDARAVYTKSPPKEVEVPSLQLLHEPQACYTYLGDQYITQQKRKDVARKLLEDSKKNNIRPHIVEKYSCKRQHCASFTSIKNTRNQGKDFCKIFPERIQKHELFNVFLTPVKLNFGRVALQSYGKCTLLIKNDSKFNVSLRLLPDRYVFYTDEKCENLKLLLKPFSSMQIIILCYGAESGLFKGAFTYTIDKLYTRRHPYELHIGNPVLTTKENSLRFGMVTSELFVTSVPVRLINYFNVDIDFEWSEICPETPFEIIPMAGTVPKQTSRLCDVIYVPRSISSKSKVIEFFCCSKGPQRELVQIEASILNRKLSIKFLEPLLNFKDIPLNMEVAAHVLLENSSREIAFFYVTEPLLPGISIEPMTGTIRPKMLVNFLVKVKIPCILEFQLDVAIKINNKENVILLLSGNVVEPKITIYPKFICINRISCGMIAFVPITLTNSGIVKTFVEVVDTGDENIFSVYVAQGNDKEKIREFSLEPNQSKTVFIKVFDVYRREYDMFIPFRFNNLIGPPNENSNSTELRYYIGQFEEIYSDNFKLKLKSVNKDIAYMRITGVITVPWLEFSTDKFEIKYEPAGENSIEFSITNISKYFFFITIITSKLSPNFSLVLINSENLEAIHSESQFKFELVPGMVAELKVEFHSKSLGRFVAVALLYLDKACTMAYHNLTFIGSREIPALIPSTYRIIFPPCSYGTTLTRTITLKMEGTATVDDFNCSSQSEPHLRVNIVTAEQVEENEIIHTIITVSISVSSTSRITRNIVLGFHHVKGPFCEVDVNFCFTNSELTLHQHSHVQPEEENPYPFYPLKEQKDIYEYLETCTDFLEKWLFLQGFRRDLFPLIPDTLHVIAPFMFSVGKLKGMSNVSIMNFFKRVAGPLIKYVHKSNVRVHDESIKCVAQIYESYGEIIRLLRSRNVHLWMLQGQYLLSHEHFIQLCNYFQTNSKPDYFFTQQLKSDPALFYRLSKQMWTDFILHCYKVFVVDSCFFECVCVSSQNRDICFILMEWYNQNIKILNTNKKRTKKPINEITNLTSDLSDGLAIIAVFMNYVPFIASQIENYCEISDTTKPTEAIINNACLILEAMTLLKIYFPLSSKDFLKPNFLQMLFLSVHLYVTLPMFQPKDTIYFLPPLLKSSARLLSISPLTPESLSFNFILLNNDKNAFSVERSTGLEGANEKKSYINVKYTARFVHDDEAVLLIHGYNKTRLFDTFIVFTLVGKVGALNPTRKSKLSCSMYRPSRADINVSSPFPVTSIFDVYLTDKEPTVPVSIPNNSKHQFLVRRLNLVEHQITLNGTANLEHFETKLYFHVVCLNTQVQSVWVWFLSDVGQFFMRMTTQPRWDMPIDNFPVKIAGWPIDPCSCGEECECYRTGIVMIPYRNELMLKALRQALSNQASDEMMNVFDDLVESTTGQIILSMLMFEGGTNMLDIHHILRKENTYRISSRNLLTRMDKITVQQHTDGTFAIPITLPANDKSEKYSITLTSECGMDIRTYRINLDYDSEG